MTIKEIKFLLRDKFINSQNIRKLKTDNICLICNNCVGGAILHDLHMRFNTPTINTWIPDEDFFKLVGNLNFYRKQPLVYIPSESDKYVVAELGGIFIHFMHETDFTKAKEDWERRFSRVDEDNIYVMYIANTEASIKGIQFIDSLNCNKIVLSYLPHDEIESCRFIRGFEQPTVKNLISYKSALSIYRGYDSFDYVQWINQGVKNER